MKVVSQSGLSIVDLNLTSGTFRNTTSLNVGEYQLLFLLFLLLYFVTNFLLAPVSFSFLKDVPIPEGWNGTSLESNLYSSAVAFEVPGTKYYLITISKKKKFSFK